MIARAISVIAAGTFGILFAAASAQAALMTFKNLPPHEDPTLSSYQEDGITMAPPGGSLGAWIIPEAQHLDDSGTGFAFKVTFTMAMPFDAFSLDVLAERNIYGDPYDNVKVEGIRDGSVVAEDAFYMGDPGSSMTRVLGPLFSNLDALSVWALRPEVVIGAFCVDAPCASFSIDNVRLDPVPLPAGLPLMAAALAGLGFAGWRRKRGDAGR